MCEKEGVRVGKKEITHRLAFVFKLSPASGGGERTSDTPQVLLPRVCFVRVVGVPVFSMRCQVWCDVAGGWVGGTDGLPGALHCSITSTHPK